MSHPIVDLHCDLLSYLANVDNANASNTDDIGCAIPFLRKGNVRLQVLASYVPTNETSVGDADRQYDLFKRLPDDYSDDFANVNLRTLENGPLPANGTCVVAAIENASALCSEGEQLDVLPSRLEEILERVGSIAYVTLTHHGENRFGGGTMTEVGLKDEGVVLLKCLHEKGIAVDLSHTSDLLARDILNCIDREGFGIPILASHSNFREECKHPRNLPDWLAKEIVNRGGVIGINFIRAFVHLEDPSHLTRHILYGFELGCGQGLCFGADFFYWKDSLDQGRIPFYHPEHENAGEYQEILDSIGTELDEGDKEALANKNAMRFLAGVLG